MTASQDNDFDSDSEESAKPVSYDTLANDFNRNLKFMSGLNSFLEVFRSGNKRSEALLGFQNYLDDPAQRRSYDSNLKKEQDKEETPVLMGLRKAISDGDKLLTKRYNGALLSIKKAYADLKHWPFDLNHHSNETFKYAYEFYEESGLTNSFGSCEESPSPVFNMVVFLKKIDKIVQEDKICNIIESLATIRPSFRYFLCDYMEITANDCRTSTRNYRIHRVFRDLTINNNLRDGQLKNMHELAKQEPYASIIAQFNSKGFALQPVIEPKENVVIVPNRENKGPVYLICRRESDGFDEADRKLRRAEIALGYFKDFSPQKAEAYISRYAAIPTSGGKIHLKFYGQRVGLDVNLK